MSESTIKWQAVLKTFISAQSPARTVSKSAITHLNQLSERVIELFTKEQISSFSELEFGLYNYITNNTKEVAYMRIRDLSNETHVSTTSILRFCRKLGFDGFTEFKLQLKQHLANKEDKALVSTKSTLTEFLERTLNQEYDEKINKIASTLVAAQSILFIGIGTSGILAEYGARYFSGLKRFALHIKDPFFPIYHTSLKDSVAIILSVSGETDYTINLTNQVKERGCSIVSITNQPDCTIAKMSDFNLSYYVTQESIGDINLTTQIPVIHLLESIAKETYKKIVESEKNSV